MNFGGNFKMDFTKKNMQMKGSMFVMLLWTSLLPFSLCVDEYQREIYLSPRNYNPHPYEHEIAKIQDPGPVVFPIEDEEGETGLNNKYNIITVDSARTKYPDDNSPYSRVAEKIKYLIDSKYGNSKDNRVEADVLDALSHQGAKVSNYSPQEFNNYGANSQPQKKDYVFAYKVLDKKTGDDFSHHQTRSAKATNGEYRVKLPDGRLQIVSYKADKDGYKADVTYEEDHEATPQQLTQGPVILTEQQYVPQKEDIAQVPVKQYVPRGQINSVNSYDYVGEEEKQHLGSPLRDSNVVVLEQAGPTQIPVNYLDVAISPTPRPSYLIGGPVDHRLQAQYYPNVKIYTTNPKDHFHGGYAPTTAATPVYKNKAIRYTSTPVPPTVQAHVVNNGDNGLFQIKVPSTYAAPVRGPNENKNIINTLVPSRANDIYRQTLEQENELPEGIYIVGKPGKR